MKYTLLLVSTIALFISAAQASPNNTPPGTDKEEAEIEGLMKRLKADLAKAQNDDGGSIESFADEQQGPGMTGELEKIMEAQVQDEKDGMEQADDGGALLQGDVPGELQQFSLAQGKETARAQSRYYRYYIHYYRLYCRWRHYYYNLLRYYKSYRHLYLTYRRLYYNCKRHRG